MENLIQILRGYAVAGRIQWRRFEDLDGDELAVLVLRGAADELADAYPFRLRPYQIVLHALRYVVEQCERGTRDEEKEQNPVRALRSA